MQGEGVSHGAMTVVNAVSTGRGAALGVDLKVKVKVNILERETTVSTGSTLLDVVCKRFLERMGVNGLGVKLSIESEIPQAVGMKSSSAVVNALILALADALGTKLEAKQVLKMNAQYSREAGVSITGAIDDAAACLLGGIRVTDNTQDAIVKSYAAKEEKVVFLIPKGVTRVDFKSKIDASLKHNALTAYTLALIGKYYEAINLNGFVYAHAFGYPEEPIILARRCGAVACGLSGNGPACAALVEEENLEKLIECWGEIGRIIVSRVYNGEAL
jgi:shikimate kinase